VTSGGDSVLLAGKLRHWSAGILVGELNREDVTLRKTMTRI